MKHPIQAARELIRSQVQRGDRIGDIAASRIRQAGSSYGAGVGPAGGSAICGGKPGFITVFSFQGKPCCHHFGLHQVYGQVRDEVVPAPPQSFTQQELFTL